MKTIRIISILFLACGAFTVSAEAQRKKPAPRKPPARVLPPLDVRAAREKVTVQRDNLNLFLDRLGPVTLSIEALDKQSKTRPLRKASHDLNERAKQNVVLGIRNFRTAMSNLETEFRTKPMLSKYMVNIQGITTLSQQSEDAAVAGRFVASREPLRTVLQKLSDTLAVMPAAQ
ncbi:MAG: hypothetical protein LC730_04660 [Acidobacteria bacterium]|nr:hypothetical protein [Acidobacteriota bacterium]MCA1608736.1 hypothetical protein [Acidobacteriota bacterium]